MGISRRKFMKTGVIVSFSAALPVKLADMAAGQHNGPETIGRMTGFQIPEESRFDFLNRLKQSTFSEQLNTMFRIHLEDSQIVKVKLVKVTANETYAEEISNARARNFPTTGESFSVVFRGTPNLPLRQKTYKFDHDSIGVFDMFVVPVGEHKGSPLYEAVFNRI